MTEILFTLFTVSFLSATLLPGSSEVILVGVLLSRGVEPWLAVAVASLGNTLGSCVNWGIGRFFVHFRNAKWFPIPAKQFDKYQRWYNKWGLWSLLASWVPIIGDPLTVFAGIARTPLWLFALIVFVAKMARYIIVAASVTYVF